MTRVSVVTAFLRCQNQVLLVRRSRQVGTYQGRWSGISGYLEDETPLQQAHREVREETGLPKDRLELAATGQPLEIPAPELGRVWVVHPFLFDIRDPQLIRLDWENLESKWVTPRDIADYPTVPRLFETLQSCLEAEKS